MILCGYAEGLFTDNMGRSMGRECPIEQPRTGEKPFIFLKKWY